MNKRDIEILEMLGEDKKRGFRLLFDAYYTPLCLYSVQIIDDFDAAEDIVQSFFVSFWEKNLHKRIGANLKSYLFASVRNSSLQYLRQSGDVNMVNVDSALVDSDMLRGLIYEMADEEELRQREARLYNELRALPEKELEALQKVVMEEMSYKEAAEEMGVSVNTIKTHLKRAMKKLREGRIPVILLFLLWEKM